MDPIENRYLNQIKQLQQQGYAEYNRGRYEDAITNWQPIWLLLQDMQAKKPALLSSKGFKSLQFPIHQWLTDYLQALSISFVDTSYELEQIRPILSILLEKTGTTAMNDETSSACWPIRFSGKAGQLPVMRFTRRLLTADPNWGWGWISWAHQYSL